MERENMSIIEKCFRNLKEYGNTTLISKDFDDIYCAKVTKFEFNQNNTITIRSELRKYSSPIFVKDSIDENASVLEAFELYYFNEKESTLPIVSIVKSEFSDNCYVSHDKPYYELNDEKMTKAMNKMYSYIEPILNLSLKNALIYYKDDNRNFTELLLKSSLLGMNYYINKPVDEILDSIGEKTNKFRQTLSYAKSEIDELKSQNEWYKNTNEVKKASY